MLKIEERQLPARILCGTITISHESRFLSVHHTENESVTLSYLVNPMSPPVKRKVYCFYAHEILNDEILTTLSFLGSLPLVGGEGTLIRGYFFETTTAEGP